MSEQIEERLLDLLCKQAVYGLTDARELKGLKSEAETSIDLESLEMTAASVSLTGVDASERIPDRLKSNILAEADKFFDRQRVADRPRTATVQEAKPNVRRPISAWLGWAVAAVASIVLIMNIWVSQSRAPILVQDTSPPATPEKPNPAQMRDKFMASAEASDMVKAEWGVGNMKDLAVAGDVVWSDKMQEGYMRFRNLPKNDKSAYTYQLWIFDETQSERTPIDGGTFDVNEDGELVVPIDAKLKARGAKAFAITMEKPGGVVVSDRKQIPALAPVKLATV